jgi:hypothetical protein
MARIALCLMIATGACTPAQAPMARKVGEGLSIGGVVGLIASAAMVHINTHTDEFMVGFSVISAVGIGMYAAGDLTTPDAIRETIPERNHRWAKILTERAAGAAREGRCPRVRRLQVRVRGYDREIHDFVFMRDPEILKCLVLPTEPTEPTESEPVQVPDPPAVPDRADPPQP